MVQLFLYESSQVEYNARGFLEKNRDTLPQGVMEMLRKSDNTLISTIFAGNYTFLMPFRRKFLKYFFIKYIV